MLPTNILVIVIINNALVGWCFSEQIYSKKINIEVTHNIKVLL